MLDLRNAILTISSPLHLWFRAKSNTNICAWLLFVEVLCASVCGRCASNLSTSAGRVSGVRALLDQWPTPWALLLCTLVQSWWPTRRAAEQRSFHRCLCAPHCANDMTSDYKFGVGQQFGKRLVMPCHTQRTQITHTIWYTAEHTIYGVGVTTVLDL